MGLDESHGTVLEESLLQSREDQPSIPIAGGLKGQTHLVDELDDKAGGVRADCLPRDGLTRGAGLPDGAHVGFLDGDGMGEGTESERDEDGLEGEHVVNLVGCVSM